MTFWETQRLRFMRTCYTDYFGHHWSYLRYLLSFPFIAPICCLSLSQPSSWDFLWTWDLQNTIPCIQHVTAKEESNLAHNSTTCLKDSSKVSSLQLLPVGWLSWELPLMGQPKSSWRCAFVGFVSRPGLQVRDREGGCMSAKKQGCYYPMRAEHTLPAFVMPVGLSQAASPPSEICKL